MPELPEIETIVHDLRALHLIGRCIVRVRVFCPKLMAPLTPGAFVRRLRGRRILGIARRAKYVVVTLSGGHYLLIHLRMTGQFSFAPADVRRERHQHILLGLDDSRELRYRDTRKFGRWILTTVPETVLGALGPEPLSKSFRSGPFVARLRAHRRRLKSLLLDQTFLAGLGNIYVDEALWEARLHPETKASALTPVESRRLHAAIRKVLRHGVANRGTTLGVGLGNYNRPAGERGSNQQWLRVFQRTGEPCPRCGAPIRRLIVGQRGTHICPACQRRGR